MSPWDPTLDSNALAACIDHTLLRPEATEGEVRELCVEARAYGFAGVCVHASWLPVVADALYGTAVKAITVAGFPHGASPRKVKAYEAAEAVRLGADEIDVVAHRGLMRSGRWDMVAADLRAAVEGAAGRPVKAILETAALGDDEIRRAAEAAERAGAAFVKTSTGYGPGGATVEAVRLLRHVVGDRLGVKASGGIRTLEATRALIAAGATRIGTSAGAAIVDAAKA